MLGLSRWFFLFAMCFLDSEAILNEEVKIIKYPDKRAPRFESTGEDPVYRHFSSPLDKCTYRVYNVLGSLSNKRSSGQDRADSSSLDLSGYALHQPLRTAPYDMYVTNLRMRLPHEKQGSVHIDKCRYEPLNKLVQTNMLFRDLTISGNIQLVSDSLSKKLLQLDRSWTNIDAFSDNLNRETPFSDLKYKGTLLREIDKEGKTFFDKLHNYNLYYNIKNPANGDDNPVYNPYFPTYNPADSPIYNVKIPFHRFHLPRPIEACNMTLKLKSVGLGLSAIPEQIIETETSRNINIKTTATYLEPNYISVHAYNCKNILSRDHDGDAPGGDSLKVYKREGEISKRKGKIFEKRDLESGDLKRKGERYKKGGESVRIYRKDKDGVYKEEKEGGDLDDHKTVGERGENFNSGGEIFNKKEKGKLYKSEGERREGDWEVYSRNVGEDEDLESEMEGVFIQGSRSLLTNYMEKQFKHVLRDTLMSNLGYTVSYGRK